MFENSNLEAHGVRSGSGNETMKHIAKANTISSMVKIYLVTA